jgi:hypothetical protein
MPIVRHIILKNYRHLIRKLTLGGTCKNPHDRLVIDNVRYCS